MEKVASVRQYNLAKTLKEGDKLLWIHEKLCEYQKQGIEESKLQKIVTIKKITDTLIKTDFGDYRLKDGKNSEIPCGCKRFCDCYGRVIHKIDATLEVSAP